jgi:Tetratricopeptide repeat
MTAAGHLHHAYGADHPEMATRRNNLGTVLIDLGDLAGARTHQERALEIGQATLRPTPRWPPSTNNDQDVRAVRR